MLYASLSDLERGEDWPSVTPFEECCDDLAGGAVVYVLETHEREAAPDMLAALKLMLRPNNLLVEYDEARAAARAAIAKAEA